MMKFSNRRLVIPSCWIFLVLLQLDPVSGTVYTNNASSTGDFEHLMAYPSLAALFGAPFEEGGLYTARLQYLVENPFLCDEINSTTTSFVGNIESPLEDQNTNELAPEVDTPPLDDPSAVSNTIQSQIDEELGKEPIVLLAARGSCPFHYKAMIAESLGLRVQYLIIYNHNHDGEDVLVPMYSEYGDTRLRLLSVTHRTGIALKRYIANASPHDRILGGPRISMDGLPPDGVMTAQDLRNVLISTLGLFFMLVSCSGCFLMCAAAAQHGRRLERAPTTTDGDNPTMSRSPLWMILMGDVDTDPVVVGDAATAARAFGSSRTLLTQEEVQDYLLVNQPPPADMSSSSNHSSSEEQQPQDSATVSEDEEDGTSSGMEDEPTAPLHCAICLDDIDENAPPETILELPCHHKFHTECIIPWLTERQAKCPLCKYDVLLYVQERAAAQASTARRRRQQPQQARRQRRLPTVLFGGFLSSSRPSSSWMVVQGQEDEDDGNLILSRVSDTSAEVELAQQAPSTTNRTNTSPITTTDMETSAPSPPQVY